MYRWSSTKNFMRQSPNIFDFFFIDKKMFIIDPINFSNGLFLQYKKISKKKQLVSLCVTGNSHYQGIWNLDCCEKSCLSLKKEKNYNNWVRASLKGGVGADTTIAIMIFLFIFFSDLIIWENWYNLNVSLNNKRRRSLYR